MPVTYTASDRPLGRVLAALESCEVVLDPAAIVTTVVLDTFDGRLHDAGLRLSFVSAPEPALVLEAGADTPPARLEWPAAPTWPAELPAGPFRARIAAVTEERALVPLAELRSSVSTGRRRDRRGKATVAITVHEQVEVAGGSIDDAPAWWLEVAPVAGHEGDAERIVRRLDDLGLDRRDGDAISTMAAAAGLDLEGHDSSPIVPLTADLDALVAFRRVLANLATTIEVNLPGTRDDVDPEFLHELRVAVRRTRSVLKEGNGVLPPEVRDRHREAFGWLQEVTGPPRDYDVYILGWDDYVSPLDEFNARALQRVRKAIDQRRRRAHRELSAALRSSTTRELLDGWRSWLEADTTVRAQQPIGPHVAARIQKAQDKVLRDGRAITPESDPERLHDLRKDTKRLRYLLECFGSLFPTKRRKAFVAQLKALQDNLGEHQDAEVHLAQLRELARDLHQRPDVDTDVLLAMGRLSDHLDRRRRDERHEFAGRFAAYDTKANRKALTDLLRPLGTP